MTSISKRNAGIIRAGIKGGRKFVALARLNPGLTSDDIIGRNLSGLFGEAYSRTVLRAPKDKVVRIRNADPLAPYYDRTAILPGNVALKPGARIEHDGQTGLVMHVDAFGRGSDLTALIDWDEPENFTHTIAPLEVRQESELLAKAWEEGWHAHYLEWEHQRSDPSHPITQNNPYRA